MRYLITFLIFLSLSVSAADWAELYKAGGLGHKVIVSYEPLKKVVKIEYRNGIFGRLRTKEYSVTNTVLVDEVSSIVSRVLKKKKIPAESIEGALEEIQNLKYLDGSSCHIVSFGSLGLDNRDELVPIIEKISKKLSLQSKAVASHFLFHLQLAEGEPVELRSLTDKDGNIIQFSLYSEKRDLSKFKIKKEGNSYHVLNNERHIFSLNIDSNNKEHVSVLKPINSRMQNVDRIHLKIKKTKKGLVSSLYSSNRNKKVLEENVIDLRNSSVQFESVSQVDDSDRYYQSLTEVEIKDLFLYFKKDEALLKNARDVFVRCMDEQYLLQLENRNDSSAEEFRKSCLKEASFEIALIFLDRNKEDELIDSYSYSRLKNNLVQCLEKEEIFKTSMNMRIITHPIKAERKVVGECVSSVSILLSKSKMFHLISMDDEVQSFLKDDNTKVKLNQNIETFFLKCISEVGEGLSETCAQKAFLKVEDEVVKLYLLQKVTSEIGNDKSIKIILAMTECNDKSLSCIKKDFLEISHNAKEDSSKEMLKLIYPASNYSLSGENSKLYRDRVINCIDSIDLSSSTSLEALQRLIDKEFECEMSAILKNVPDFSVQEILAIEPFSMISDSEKNRFIEIAKRKVRKATRNLTFISEIQSETNKVYEKLLPEFVDFYIDNRFEDKEVSQRSRESIIENFTLSLNGVKSKSVKQNVSSILKRQNFKRLDFNSGTFVKDSLRNFEVNLFSQLHEDNESISFKKCMSDYSPQWKDISLESYVLKCENKNYAKKFFKLKKDELEKGVSTHFPLASLEANDALSPVFYLEKCINSQPVFNESVRQYRKSLNTCYLISKLDVLSNVSELNILKNRKVLSSNGTSNSLKVSKECFENFYLSLLRESKISEDTNSTKILKKLILGNGDNILGLMKRGHLNNGKGSLLTDFSSGNELLSSFIANLSQADFFNEDFVDSYVKSCTSSVDDNLYNSFQEYILQNISASFDLRRNDAGESNKEILQKVFDQELLAELLKLSQKSTNANSISSHVDPRRFQVTSELGVETLSKLIELIGESISKGFVFDKDLMKTELVVFRSELKRALKWLNATDQPVSLEELQKFFTTTKLADLLAYATVSEQVYDRFNEFISSQENSEKFKLKRKFGYISRSNQTREQKNEWDRMLMKFSIMRREAKSMTSSYDFRRLFRQGNESSKLKLSKIKTNYLLPLITTGNVSPHAKNDMMKIVADLILKDNSKGGFAEKFVGSAASEFLQNESEDHWALTKWLFYDDGDFSWNDLKSTKSGGEAVDYYGKYILLPDILKQNVSKFTKEYRLNHFKKLLRNAQNEHDD